MSDAARGYLRLDPKAVAKTLDRLHDRIKARFPERDLVQVASAVGDAIRDVPDKERVARQLRWVRIGRASLITFVWVLVSIGLAIAMWRGSHDFDKSTTTDWVQSTASALQIFVYSGVAVLFATEMPNRWMRRGVLKRLHTLRSVAHVVDMHQLTKDPDRLRSGSKRTSVSPDPELSADDLGRYLEYCSELLSLIGKAAALYAEISRDPIVLDTVSEIESLTIGLSRKIWQKLAMLQTARDVMSLVHD